jgi:hypothetical protein
MSFLLQTVQWLIGRMPKPNLATIMVVGTVNIQRFLLPNAVAGIRHLECGCEVVLQIRVVNTLHADYAALTSNV